MDELRIEQEVMMWPIYHESPTESPTEPTKPAELCSFGFIEADDQNAKRERATASMSKVRSFDWGRGYRMKRSGLSAAAEGLHPE